MPALSRTVNLRGPHFWRDAKGEVQFEMVLDGSTRSGARAATGPDMSEHAEAYRTFLEREEGQEPGAPGKPLISALDPTAIPPNGPRPYAERRARARPE